MLTIFLPFQAYFVVIGKQYMVNKMPIKSIEEAIKIAGTLMEAKGPSSDPRDIANLYLARIGFGERGMLFHERISKEAQIYLVELATSDQFFLADKKVQDFLTNKVLTPVLEARYGVSTGPSHAEITEAIAAKDEECKSGRAGRAGIAGIAESKTSESKDSKDTVEASKKAFAARVEARRAAEAAKGGGGLGR